MKVLVCGGRDYQNRKYLFDSLDAIHYHEGVNEKISIVIHGANRGADTLADEWALSRGVQPVRCPANWTRYEKAAGPRRNRLMLLLQPDLCIAFDGGDGTTRMVELAHSAGIKIKDLRIV